MLDLSVVIPARDERDNVEPLLDELAGVLDRLDLRSEIIVVDDASGDGTGDTLDALVVRHSRLTVVSLASPEGGGGHGQTAAWRSGFAVADGRLIATLDADLQNDPADLPMLLETLETTGADLVQGDRTMHRCDGVVKRISSGVGRLFRRVVLGDRVRDTCCSLRVMRRVVAETLPLEFRGMHRFIPELARQRGFAVVERPVNHRPRRSGRTHYGIRNRALVGLVDLVAVRWMRRRRQAAPVVRAQADRTRLRRVS